MKKVLLNKGKIALVDDEDFKSINKFHWFVDHTGYAVRHTPREKGKVRKLIYMHRVINNTPLGFETDHIDGNRLNNSKSNLRTVTHQKNLFNLRLPKNNTSGVIGVTRLRDKWQAQITVNMKNVFLGLFDDFEQACLSRKKAEREYHVI